MEVIKKIAWFTSVSLAFVLGHVLGSPTVEPRFLIPNTGMAWRCSSCADTGPLYFQWAAMPSSAILCISSVRIWISNGVPSSVITEVCSDWSQGPVPPYGCYLVGRIQ